MSYNILILGNGFDLAHKIPSKYRNFLTFCYLLQTYTGDTTTKNYSKYTLESNEERNLYAFICNDIYERNEFFSKVKEIIDEENIYPKYGDVLPLLMDNVWISHFYGKAGDKNWIDFESEIARIINTFDSIYWSYIQAGETGRASIPIKDNDAENAEKIIKELQDTFNAETVIQYKKNKASISITIDKAEIDNLRIKISSDLEKLTELLGFYLSIVLALMVKSKKLHAIDQIKSLQIDKVLSFNYTNTYELLYDTDKTNGKIDYHYIHGTFDRNEESDVNMVLGVDDYLEKDLSNSLMNEDTYFIEYKKYYQRILKKTGTKYLQWKHALDTNGFQSQLYIYGHSLDKTDKDVLSGLILSETAHTNIFYRDKKDLGDKIANLVRVIGRDNTIEFTGNGKLEFIEIDQD